MRIIIVTLVALLYAIECNAFKLFPSTDKVEGLSVSWVPIDSLTAIYHEKYSLSIEAWKKRKSTKNLEKMRTAKKRLGQIKSLKKSGQLTLYCKGRTFTEERTFSIWAYGKRGEEFIGRHSLVGLADSMYFFVDLKPEKIVVIDQVSKEVSEFKL